MSREQQIKAIVDRQRAFFDTGVTKQYGFRQAALARLETALDMYRDDLCVALYMDLHKSYSESCMAEVGIANTELKYVRRHLAGWMRPKRCMTELSQFPGTTYTVAEPHGVVLVMAPWNYPVALCLEPVIDAIAAGNCVVLKPSAYTPTVSSVLKYMLESVFPAKYVTVIEGGREENEALLEQRFDYIFFTGGVTVGKLVLEKAAKHVTPVTLELGGKSPCIIDKTADLRIAARRVAFGKLLNAGQTCVAPDYLLVHEEIKDRFLAMLKDEITRMEKGNALENQDYPRIINDRHFHRLLKLIEGEKVIFGGDHREETLQIAPTILDDITLESPVMQEEIFGPILPVLTFNTPRDLRRIINSFEKPLAFYLFTRDKGMKDWALRTFSFGGCCINNTIMHMTSSHMPFGGVGASGMGNYHGKYGFETFSHTKGVLESFNHPDLFLIRQPYEDWKDRLMRMFQ